MPGPVDAGQRLTRRDRSSLGRSGAAPEKSEKGLSLGIAAAQDDDLRRALITIR